MSLKPSGIGLYEFLIESELQHYYNAIKNDLKVQSVVQFKYVTEEDMVQIGMSRPEIRRLKKYFQKHYPQTYLAKMKKKLLSRKEDNICVAAMANAAQNAPGRPVKTVAPGRHIIQAESIVIHKKLGSGEFGTVQQGVWTSDDGQRTQVAIKCLSQERMENNPVEFLKEAAIMHQVDHEHIVRLYGVVLDTSALMLVTELAPLRSLLECLKEPSMLPNLSVPTLYDFAVQICDGMQYLESKRLIHRDLAARNILVFSRNKVKISDFGLSRALGVGKDYYQTNFNVNLKLPIAWCAPECINFLRFTSASDVWAYGVALWEVFSYGFQPWAALTGQQILEAIDEPNYQRLEKPECCPNEIYYQVMLKCWQHDPANRPTFAQLSNLILESKPEQVQAIKESESKNRRDYLVYETGDLITVLDRTPLQTTEDTMLWKGVLKCGKSGLFNPANTITYLGSSLPSVKQSQSPFHRNDSRSSSLRKGRISADMISGPQGDLKHTGHVGPDGQVFGDITFLGAKCWVPRQVVPPYKPEPSATDSNGVRHAPPPLRCRSVKGSSQDLTSSDTAPLLETAANMSSDDGSKPSTSVMKRRPMMVTIPGTSFNATQDHEYHEISDEENELVGAVGVSNPALSTKSQSPVDSPRFEKSFDLDLGPSLIDEVFSALEQDTQEHPDEAHNVKNELREMARSKKRFVSVKAISSSDRRTLDHAIAMANELASKSMLDLDRSGKSGMTNCSLDDISSPRTPTSPTQRKKFSFMLGASKNDRERRNYSQETASIPDIQSTLTDEAKDAYNCLVEKPAMNTLGFLTPSFANKSMSFHFPEKCGSKKADFFEPESKAINGPQSLTEISIPTSSQPAEPTFNVTNFPGKFHCRSFSKNDADEIAPVFTPPANPPLPTRTKSTESLDDDEIDGNPLRLLRQNKQAMLTNVLPLPPKKSGSGSVSGTSTITRHQRKHPLLIPNRLPLQPSDGNSHPSVTAATREPPAPPPKPQRQSGVNSVISSKSSSSSYGKAISSHHRSASIPEEPLKTSEIDATPEPAYEHENPTYGSGTPSFTDCTIQEITARLGSMTNKANNRSEAFSQKSESSRDSVLVYENMDVTVDSGLDSSSVSKSPLEANPSSRTATPSDDIVLDYSGVLSSTPSANTSSSGISSSTHSLASSSTRLSQISLDQKQLCQSEQPEANGHSVFDAGVERWTRLSIADNRSTQSTAAAVELPVLRKPFKISPGNSIKIKTLQRILGSTASEEDCEWALEATDSDSAHAVKLLRLKSLLPEALVTEDASRIVSVLEMSHWDVARAAAFLLEKSLSHKPTAKPRLRSFQSSYTDNRNVSSLDADSSSNGADGINNNQELNVSDERNKSNYIRPTQV